MQTYFLQTVNKSSFQDVILLQSVDFRSKGLKEVYYHIFLLQDTAAVEESEHHAADYSACL